MGNELQVHSDLGRVNEPHSGLIDPASAKETRIVERPSDGTFQRSYCRLRPPDYKSILMWSLLRLIRMGFISEEAHDGYI